MLLVPRRARRILEEGNSKVENPIQPLAEFRNKTA